MSNKLYKALNTKDRIDTGFKDYNGESIHVGDVIKPIFNDDQFYVNYNAQKNEFYAIAKGNKGLKSSGFDKCINIGKAVFNSDLE